MILGTLGGLAIEGVSFGRPKPLLLLTYLALEGPTERRYLSDLFWLGASNPRGSLSTALSQLRGGVPGVVGTDDVRVFADVECDATLFLRAVEERNWLDAVELYRGPFLEGVDLSGECVELVEWLYGTREFLANGMRTALLALGEKAAKDERFAEVGTWAARAYEIGASVPPGPHDIARLYTLLMASNNPLARSLYEEASALGHELPLTTQGARATFRDAPTATTAHTLPSRTATFIGRSKELEELERLLLAPESRLVSLIGAGGSGKTRLSLHIASAQSGSDRWSGVYFVAFETLEDVDRVMPAIAEAFGFRLQENMDPVSQLSQFVGSTSPEPLPGSGQAYRLRFLAFWGSDIPPMKVLGGTFPSAEWGL